MTIRHPASDYVQMQLRILAVCMPDRASDPSLSFDGTDGIALCAFTDLQEAINRGGRPDVVLAPLVSEGFDAMDVLGRLVEVGYRGSFRALSTDLPNVSSVIAELRSVAPATVIDVGIITLSELRAATQPQP